MNRRQYAIALLFSISLLTTALVPLSGQLGNSYNPWLDFNDDGVIDVEDLAALGGVFGTQGSNITKASMTYDSDWINITDKAGRCFDVIHNLNIIDWNDPGLIVEITGKTAVDSELLRYRGLNLTSGWSRTFGGTEWDLARSLVQTSDGGFAAAGSTNYTSGGGSDVYFVKTRSDGSTQWARTYGGASDDEGNFVIKTADGGYAIAGSTRSFGAGGSDAYLVKTNSAGSMQWQQTYGGGGNDCAISMALTATGQYALAGYTNSYGAGGIDVYLYLTDRGIYRYYGGTADDYALSVIRIPSDDGYALAGYTASFGAGGGDFWLIRTNTLGSPSWMQTYGGPGAEEAYSVIRTDDNGFALAGYTTSYGAGGSDFWLVRTNSVGDAQWNRTYGGTNDDYAYSVVQTVDGGFALAGSTSPDLPGSSDLWLVKTDSMGNAEWNITLGGTGGDYSLSQIVPTADGGYVLAGYTDSYGNWGFGAGDLWLVKTNIESGLAWTDSTADSITLYRGTSDTDWNYVRVRIWKTKQNP